MKDGKPTYVTYLKKMETMLVFFFLEKFHHLTTKKDSPKFEFFFLFSVNLKNIWKIMPKFPSHKIEKKHLEPCYQVEVCFFFWRLVVQWQHVFMGKLGGFWKINAISIKFGDFMTHVAIYWKTN